MKLAPLLALLLVCFIGISLAAPQPPLPEYLRLKVVSNNKVIAVLRKGLLTLNGAPVWQTPDNQTAKIYLKSFPFRGKTIEDWDLFFRSKQAEFQFTGPVQQKIGSPHEVIWFYKEEEQNFLVVEQSDKNEYETTYPNSQPKSMEDQADLETSDSGSGVHSTHPTVQQPLVTQPQPEITVPEYLSWKHAFNGSFYTVVKKSDEKQNGFPIWQTPDKAIRIYLKKANKNAWIIDENSKQVLVGTFNRAVVSPQNAKWHSWNLTEQDWLPGKYLVEESDEEEYKKTFPQPDVQHTPVAHPQHETCPSGPEYLRVDRAENNEVLYVMKIDEMKNGSSIWQTPDNTTVTLSLTTDPAPVWVLRVKSKVALLGPGNGVPNTCIAPPHIVRWLSNDPKDGKWKEDQRYLFRETTEEEYKNVIQNAQQTGVSGVLVGVGGESGEGLAGLPLLASMTSTLLNPKMTAAMAIGGILSRTGVIGAAGSGASGLVNGVGGLSSGVLDGVSKGAGGLFTGTGKLMNSGLSVIGLDPIGGGLEVALGGIGGALGDVGQGFGKGINDITSGTSEVLNKITDSLGDVFGGGNVVEGATNILGGGVQGITGIVKGSGSVAQGLLKGAGGLGSTAFNTIGKTTGGIFNSVGLGGVGDVFESAGSGLGSVTSGVANTVGNVARGVTDTVGTVTRGVTDTVSKFKFW